MKHKEAEELARTLIALARANKESTYDGEGKIFILLFIDWLYEQGFEIVVKGS